MVSIPFRLWMQQQKLNIFARLALHQNIDWLANKKLPSEANFDFPLNIRNEEW